MSQLWKVFLGHDTRKTEQIMLNTVSIKLGCGIEKELYEGRTGRGRATLTQYETWRETLTVPGEGTERVELTCPTCHNSFEVKVHSKSKARLRKLCFASIFFAIATVGIIFGAFAGRERGFIGYSIGAVFIYFTLWQSFNAIRGKFDATDLVVHARGKCHRIFDEKDAITFPDLRRDKKGHIPK